MSCDQKNVKTEMASMGGGTASEAFFSLIVWSLLVDVAARDIS